MATIKVEVISNKKEMNDFIQLPYHIYKDCPQYVPDLESDIRDLLNPQKNSAFKFSHIKPFVAYKDGVAVGRIVGLINKKANEHWKRKNVRFSLIEFIDDQEVSAALLGAVEEWGRQRGMTEMAGPLGFIDTDREGMLIDGFDELSTMYVNYNYPYYPKHIEAIGGFRKDNDYVELRIKVPEDENHKFHKIAQMVEKRYGLSVHKFTRRELIDEGMGREVFRLLNATYKDLYGFSQLSQQQIDKLVNDYIKIADLNLVTAVMDGDSMVGFGITFSSLSRALQKTRNGRLWPFGWWHVLQILKRHRTDTVDLLLIGVLPEYRSKGANALIFDDLIHQYQRYGFSWAVTGPQMESNEGVLAQWQYLDSEIVRRHRCYRKELASV